MKKDNKNLKTQVEDKLLKETDPSKVSGGWKRLSSKAKAAITAGAVVLTGGGVAAGIGAGAGLFSNGSAQEPIRLIFTKPGIEASEESIVRDELNALEEHFNKTSFLPQLEVHMQADTDTVDLERLIADGVFDIALSKADDFISDAAINPNPDDPTQHEVQYMSVSYRNNMYWDPYLNGSSAYANYNTKDRDEDTGRYSYQQGFAKEQAQIMELLNRPMNQANAGMVGNGVEAGDKLEFGAPVGSGGTSSETPADIDGSADQEGEEWVDENAGWYRAELTTSQMGSEEWLTGNGGNNSGTLNFKGVDINDPLGQANGIGNNQYVIERDELVDVTITNGQELHEYINGVFAAAQNLSFHAPQGALDSGPVSIGAITNLAEARNFGNNNEETLKYLFTYKSRTSSSGILGARQIFEHTFQYDNATDYANGEVTETDFWVPKDNGEDTALALPTRYIKPKEAAAQHHYDDVWSTGHSLMASDFSGWRQQSGNAERWDAAAADRYGTNLDEQGSYVDGRVVAVSYPIFNDGWIVRRDMEESDKEALNAIVNYINTLPSDDDPTTFLPGDFIARYSHGGYEMMDDSVLLED